MTYTDPVVGGSITVNNYDGSLSFKAGEEGVQNSIPQELNEQDKSEYDTWKIDTEDFTKYFYSKSNEAIDLSSQMCTSYRRIGATKPIAMKENDVYTVHMGYKIYDRTFATEPVAQDDGDKFMLLIGEASSSTLATTFGALATILALSSF